MTDITDELLKHRVIYIPWRDETPLYQAGPAIAQYLAKAHRVPLSVLCITKNNAPDELSRVPIVTERSGSLANGGVVLVFCPNYKLLSKLAHLSRSVIVMVEWPTENLSGWARLHGAYNLITQEEMAPGLSDQVRELLEQITFDGYKGWDDSIAVRITERHLADLLELGEYDRELVLAYCREERGERGIEKLYKILDRFDAGHGS